MAFKILSEEELSLLTAAQIERYEKEFEIYKQRQAFIEKITAFEKAEVKPYKPELKSIGIIGEIKLSPYKRSERQKLRLEHTQKAELPDNLIGKVNKKINIKETVKSGSAQKKRIEFNRRLFSKAENFKRYERKQYTIPAFSKPVIPGAAFVKSEYALSESVKVKKSVLPGVAAFNAPNKTEIVLSKAAIQKINIGNFIMPESLKPVLPVYAKPHTTFKPFVKLQNLKPEISINEIPKETENTFKKPVFTITDFPEILRPSADMPAFHMPEKNKPKIYVNLKSDIKIGSFKISKTAVTGFPQIRMPHVNICGFQPPMQLRPDIKLNTASDVKVKSFKKPKFKAAELPEIYKISISPVRFRIPKKQEIKSIAAVKPNINIKSFEKPQGLKTHIPEIPKTKVNIGSFAKPEKVKPEINAQLKPLKPISDFRKPEFIMPVLSDIKVCREFEISAQTQDILSILNKESAL